MNWHRAINWHFSSYTFWNNDDVFLSIVFYLNVTVSISIFCIYKAKENSCFSDEKPKKQMKENKNAVLFGFCWYIESISIINYTQRVKVIITIKTKYMYTNRSEEG